ncbi:MAG: DUF6807 family protein [Puia sp.]
MDFQWNQGPENRPIIPHHLGLWLTYENVNGLDFWNNSYAIPLNKKSQYGWIKNRQHSGTDFRNNGYTAVSCKVGESAERGPDRRKYPI